MKERSGTNRSKDLTLKDRTITTTTYIEKVSGKETTKKVLKVEHVTYENLEAEGLRKKAERVINQQYQSSIPRKLQNHAITLVSQVYSDAELLWNPENKGTFDPQRVVYKTEVDESSNNVGKTLKEGVKNIKTILRLINDTFVTSEGRNNENFQLFLKTQIVNRMGIKDEELGNFGASDWFGKKE